MKILSLGAGVQSSTIFLMSCYGELERIDAAIFADTGWEPQEVYQWLEFLKAEGEKHGIPIHVVQQGNIKKDALMSQVRGTHADGSRAASMPYYVLGPNGERGMLRRQCTNEYKLAPIRKKTRALVGFKPRQRMPVGAVETWKGISLDELRRVSVAKERWNSFYYPLIELRMTRHDCLLWFDKKGLPRAPRSSCISCPYHHNREWRRMRDNSPAEWAEAVLFDRAIRKMDKMNGSVFLHADRVPLDKVDLSIPEDHGQLNMFRDECMGICGI